MGNSKDNIKVLPEELSRNGYRYFLVTRTPKEAIYKQTLDNVQIGFEVFLIRIRGPRYSSLLRKGLDAYERFPANSDFGKTAWSFQNYQDALDKFNVL